MRKVLSRAQAPFAGGGRRKAQRQREREKKKQGGVGGAATLPFVHTPFSPFAAPLFLSFVLTCARASRIGRTEGGGHSAEERRRPTKRKDRPWFCRLLLVLLASPVRLRLPFYLTTRASAALLLPVGRYRWGKETGQGRASPSLLLPVGRYRWETRQGRASPSSVTDATLAGFRLTPVGQSHLLSLALLLPCHTHAHTRAPLLPPLFLALTMSPPPQPPPDSLPPYLAIGVPPDVHIKELGPFTSLDAEGGSSIARDPAVITMRASFNRKTSGNPEVRTPLSYRKAKG